MIDFLASYIEDEISIYYGLIGYDYKWSIYFNEIIYSSFYYNYKYSIGREFGYLLKRKYINDNINKGMLNRTRENRQFFLSYSFDDLPSNVYKNFTNLQFGNSIVTVNLDFKLL